MSGRTVRVELLSPALPLSLVLDPPLPGRADADTDSVFGGRDGLGGTGRGGGGLETPSGFPWGFLVGEVEGGERDEVEATDKLVCNLGRGGGRGELLGEFAGEFSLLPLLCLLETGG